MLPYDNPFCIVLLWMNVHTYSFTTQDEMLGKLKELGNSLLGKFGMSLDNFKAVKDPATGSYSISFQR